MRIVYRVKRIRSEAADVQSDAHQRRSADEPPIGAHDHNVELIIHAKRFPPGAKPRVRKKDSIDGPSIGESVPLLRNGVETLEVANDLHLQRSQVIAVLQSLQNGWMCEHLPFDQTSFLPVTK